MRAVRGACRLHTQGEAGQRRHVLLLDGRCQLVQIVVDQERVVELVREGARNGPASVSALPPSPSSSAAAIQGTYDCGRIFFDAAAASNCCSSCGAADADDENSGSVDMAELRLGSVGVGAVANGNGSGRCRAGAESYVAGRG